MNASFSKAKSESSKQQNQSSKKNNVNAYHSSKQSTPNVSSPLLSSPNVTNAAKSVGRKFTCAVCNGEGHTLRACKFFLEMSVAERKNMIDKIRHCSNCFAFNHIETKC